MKDRKNINCQNCKFWAFDMDMDAFCVNKNAGPVGTILWVMRNTVRVPHMRGDPCGPTAKYFVQETKSPYAKTEPNI